MTKDMLNILLTIHILGDFYFQSQKMADNKKVKLVWVLRHSIIYAVVAFTSYILALIPILLFYIICQKQILNGVANGAVKG